MIDSVNQVSGGSVSIENNPHIQEKKSAKDFISDNKVLVGVIGAAALAATVTGGILFHKSQKLTKEIEKLYKTESFRCSSGILFPR